MQLSVSDPSSSTTLSAVVPLIESHVRFFGSLIRDLESQTRPFDEIVIVASGLGHHSVSSVEKVLKSSRFSSDYQILSNSLFPSGKNRNSGALVAKSNLVMFLDADDTYHPQRNEIALQIYKRTSFAALVMRTVPFSEPDTFSWNTNLEIDLITEQHLVSPKDTYDATFPFGRARHKEMLGAPSVIQGHKNPRETGRELGVLHHGHIVVEKNIFLDIKQHELSFPRNEDSVFARDILWSGRRLYVLNLATSGYRTSSSSNNPENQSLWSFIKAVPGAYFLSPVPRRGTKPS